MDKIDYELHKTAKIVNFFPGEAQNKLGEAVQQAAKTLKQILEPQVDFRSPSNE